MKKLLLLIALLIGTCTFTMAQRNVDRLDRGLIAIPSGSGNFVSWKIFGEEYYDTKYNLYRDGTKLNQEPLTVSNYQDNGGGATSEYQVAAVVRGVEQPLCARVRRWSNIYYEFNVKPVLDRDGNDVSSQYIINDVSLGDVDGDGVVEFIVKRNYTGSDLNTVGNTTKFNHYECYNIKGDRLWWIDLGPNLMAGPDEQWDIVAFDWDQDGKAECVMRGADNMIFHTSDGRAIGIGDMSYVAPRDEYTHFGAEYLIYFNGETAEPYGCEPRATRFTPMDYPLPRFEQGESDYETVWGKADTGHRSSKHYFGAPYLDGQHASIFLARGCYTQHKMCALDVDPVTHELTIRWRWSNNKGWSDPWYGNGYHNYGIADVDWDGRDEIVFGSMVIDDNGQGLSTTGLGHGDAQICGDLDPFRHGQEFFACNEDEPAMNYRDATTSKIYYRLQSTGDDGRSLCGNFSNSFPGMLGRSTQSGLVSTVADKVIQGGPSTSGTNDALYYSHLNFRIYWDGDLLDEILDSPGVEREAAVYKPEGGRLFTSLGCKMNNSSKNNPCASADILGDWREEIVVRTGDDKAIRIYSTTTPTEFALYTLWHDHQYRNAMVWQCIGYNQPPRQSYFVGELEGITIAPPPLITNGRTVIANGGSISGENADQHVMVCENANTEISVQDGANPYIATFNVPSWVQGTTSYNIANPFIKYEYYTCNVTGGAFAGDMKLVKQGDGVLNLPNVEQLYTGETNIWAGTLNFDGKLKNSPLWLNRFAALNSDGGEFKSIAMLYDAKLRPGRAENKGSLTVDSLALGIGARVVFDIYSDDISADTLKVSKLNIMTKNWNYGPKYLTPVFEFVPHNVEGSLVAEGRYCIGEVSEVIGKLSDIKLEGLGTSQKQHLVLEDGKLYLEISGMRDASSVVWNGLVDGTWDLASTQNFTLLSDPSSTNEMFVTGDNVYFTDEASQYSVTLKGDLEADSVIVDNTVTYTFKGTGSIVGGTTLVKRGTGILTINNDNTFRGGTRISGGMLSVSSLANENQAQGNLGVVTSAANKFIIENGAVLRTTAAVTQGSPMQMLGEEGGIVNNLADFIVNRSISGTVLTKQGTGWMKMNVNNEDLNKIIMTSGTLQNVSCSMPARSIELRGGTIQENSGTSYAIEVPASRSGTWTLAERAAYGNKLTGAGTITINLPVVIGSGWAATRTNITGNWSEFTGVVIPQSSNDPDKRFSLDNGYGLPLGTMKIPSGVVVQNSGKTYQIGKVDGAGSLGGVCTFVNGASTATPNTWIVGNDENFSWDGKVVDSGTIFTKVGTGKMTVKGVWTNSGTTTIQEGEIYLSSSASLGTGPLMVSTNGVFTGTSSSTNPLKNSQFNVNGIIRPGVTEMSTSGFFDFNGKNVTFGSSGVYRMLMQKCANANSTGGTYLKNINRLVMNGTIELRLHSSYTPHEGDSVIIWQANTVVGNPKFNLPDLSEYNLEWDTSRVKEGLLFIRATTGILGLTTENMIPRHVYNMRGEVVRMNAVNLNGLPRGIYFWQGRKVVVK